MERLLDLIVWGDSLICDGEPFRVFPVCLEQLEKLAFLDPKECLSTTSVYLFIEISL